MRKKNFYSSPSASDRRAFTLVELLVVIAIIALLVSIIVPAVGGARRSAMTASSLSNLTQIHKMFFYYLIENKDLYPVSIEQTGSLFWRREVWEYSSEPFEGSTTEVMEGMQSSAYSKVMWCPLMVKRHGQEQHPGGRGSYALNKFFSPPSWGGGYRYSDEGALVGVKEPYIFAGTVLDGNPEYGTYEHIESSQFPYDTAWMNVAYEYGGSGDSALGLFVDGHAEVISKEDGIALDPLLKEITELE